VSLAPSALLGLEPFMDVGFTGAEPFPGGGAGFGGCDETIWLESAIVAKANTILEFMAITSIS